jgi:hypothetical protein
MYKWKKIRSFYPFARLRVDILGLSESLIENSNIEGVGGRGGNGTWPSGGGGGGGAGTYTSGAGGNGAGGAIIIFFWSKDHQKIYVETFVTSGTSSVQVPEGVDYMSGILFGAGGGGGSGAVI